MQKFLWIFFIVIIWVAESIAQDSSTITTPNTPNTPPLTCDQGKVLVYSGGNNFTCEDNNEVCVTINPGDTYPTIKEKDANGFCPMDGNAYYITLRENLYNANGVLYGRSSRSDNTNKLLAMVSEKTWDSDRWLKLRENTGSSAAQVRSNLANLCKIGLLMAFLLFMVQIFLDFVNLVLGQGVHPMKIIQKNLAKAFLVAVLLTPSIYETIISDWLGAVLDAIANGILEEIKANTWGEISKMNTASSKDGFWTSLTNSIVTNVLGKIILLFSWILHLIYPLLQSALFALVLYLGPLCIPFMMFDGTSAIPRNWFSFALTVCFFSVVAAVAMLISYTGGFYGALSGAAVNNNPIIMAIYGVLTIVMIVLSYPIAASIMGNAGGSGGLFMSGGIAAAGMLTAGAAAGVGVAAKGVGAAAGAAAANATSSGDGGSLGARVASSVANGANAVADGSMAFAREQFNSAQRAAGMTPSGGVRRGDSGSRDISAPETQMSRQEQERISGLKDTMEQGSEMTARDIRNEASRADLSGGEFSPPASYSALGSTLAGFGYNLGDVAYVGHDANGNIVCATMKTGDQFVATPGGGWSSASSGRASSGLINKVEESLTSEPLSNDEKKALSKRSNKMLDDIHREDTPLASTVDRALTGTGYSNKDVASVQVDRVTNEMSGVTMRTGEQFNYDNRRREFVPTVEGGIAPPPPLPSAMAVDSSLQIELAKHGYTLNDIKKYIPPDKGRSNMDGEILMRDGSRYTASAVTELDGRRRYDIMPFRVVSDTNNNIGGGKIS